MDLVLELKVWQHFHNIMGYEVFTSVQNNWCELSFCFRIMPQNCCLPSWKAAMTVRMRRESCITWGLKNWWMALCIENTSFSCSCRPIFCVAYGDKSTVIIEMFGWCTGGGDQKGLHAGRNWSRTQRWWWEWRGRACRFSTKCGSQHLHPGPSGDAHKYALTHTICLRSLCQISGLSHHLPLPVCFSIDFLPIHVIIWVNVRRYVTMLGTVQLFHRLSKWCCLASGVHEWKKKQRTNSTLDTVIQFYPNIREMCFGWGWDSKG